MQMESLKLLSQIEALPEALKAEVADFVAFLSQKQKPEKKIVPKFGSAKGKIHMSPDFDEPLDDFKEYM